MKVIMQYFTFIYIKQKLFRQAVKLVLPGFFLISLYPEFSYCQDPAGKLLHEYRTLATRNAKIGLKYEEVNGSPFYTDNFVNSAVYLNNGDYASIPLHYDLFQDEIEFTREDKTYWLIKKDIKHIEYGLDTLASESLSKNPDKFFYFFVKEKGKYSLYSRKIRIYAPYEPPGAYTESKPDRFESLPDEYFLKLENQPPFEIINKKILLEILKNNKPAIDFIKKSKTNVNKEADLLELIRFLNNQY